MADTRKECCKPENGNLTVVEQRSDLVVQKCAICGCRHFEVTLQPGVIGLRGIGLKG